MISGSEAVVPARSVFAGDVAQDEHVFVALVLVEPGLDLVYIDVCPHCIA